MSHVLNDEVPKEYVLEEYSECSISILLGMVKCSNRTVLRNGDCRPFSEHLASR